jgi:hypothetical protein
MQISECKANISFTLMDAGGSLRTTLQSIETKDLLHLISQMKKEEILQDHWRRVGQMWWLKISSRER